ncbi:chalcone synthase 2-like [Trifolium medium]|uniref:Chalcone synthase 2-like n=1 Tax=Trifolium medium TaxID=97028 RepID=A0A392P9Y9_9FABA|nr:chalcone synthase 2-like [Trifolium medium]
MNNIIQMEKRVEKKGEAPRGKSVATILAIGTANPPNFILQSHYPDFYFKDVNIDSDDDDDDHLQRLKLKFKRIFSKEFGLLKPSGHRVDV